MINTHIINVGAYSEQNDGRSSFLEDRLSTSNSIMFFPAPPTEVEQYINIIKSNVAPGCDEPRPVPIKHVPKQISNILSRIVNTTLE